MNSTFVESLRRLYKSGKITIGKLDTYLSAGKITRSEYDYITS